MSKWSEINAVPFSPCGINAVIFSTDKLNISWTFYYDKCSSDPRFQIGISSYLLLHKTVCHQDKGNTFTTNVWAPLTEYLRKIWSPGESVASASRKSGHFVKLDSSFEVHQPDVIQGAMETVPKNSGALWTSWTLRADYGYLYGCLLADIFHPLNNKYKQFLFTIETCLCVTNYSRQFILHYEGNMNSLMVKKGTLLLNLKNEFK